MDRPICCPECSVELDFMGRHMECSRCKRVYPASEWTIDRENSKIRPLTEQERWFGGPYKKL